MQDETMDSAISSERPRGWLARWYDPGLDLPKDLTTKLLDAQECERIARSLNIILYAMTMPRRLGGDAADEELAADKKRCRRVSHALRQAYRGWNTKAPPALDSPEIRQAGAQLIWEDFKEAERNILDNHSRLCATFAVRFGEERWGKTAITNFENERNWVEYALRL